SAGGGAPSQQFRDFSSTGTSPTPHPASRQLSTACGDPADAHSPQRRPRAVEFARKFPLGADVFVHTPSARCANIRSEMPAKSAFLRALSPLFHNVAGPPSARFTPR